MFATKTQRFRRRTLDFRFAHASARVTKKYAASQGLHWRTAKGDLMSRFASYLSHYKIYHLSQWRGEPRTQGFLDCTALKLYKTP